jgi:large subunit ribosomal protein L25
LDLITLQAMKREKTGNGPARVLRRGGRIPAVLYGPGTEPALLSVAVSDLEHALKNNKIGQALLSLKIGDGESTRSAMIREFQIDPFSRAFLHVDFYEIAMDRKIRVKVPIVTKGMSKGVEFGGLLQIVRREIEVLCLQTVIPKAIEVDVTELEIGDSIHVKDIPLAAGVEIPPDVNFTIVTVLSQKVEEKPGEGGAVVEGQAPGAETT